MENGVYKRNTEQKMPESHIAFLDEIFKSNSAILNSLLTLINERVFYNNGSPVKTPLMTIVGASNEYPEEDEGLEALFDRFLLRFELDYIGDERNFLSMMKGNGQKMELPSVTLDELQEFQFQTEMVDIPDEIYNTLLIIRNELKNEGIRPLDRRFKQSLRLLQAKALINQRQQVRVDDILLLENVLWENIDQKDLVKMIVKENAQDSLASLLEKISENTDDILQNVQGEVSTDNGLEATQKLKMLEEELQYEKLNKLSRVNEILSVLEKVQAGRKQIAGEILSV